MKQCCQEHTENQDSEKLEILTHPLDAIIDNGSFVQLGINASGNLNIPGGISPPQCPTNLVGLRYIPTNGDATSPGNPNEGWGVANADVATIIFSAFVSARFGLNNLTIEPGTGVTKTTGQILPNSVGSAYRSIVADTFGRVEVTHNFKPSKCFNLYRIDVTIKNIGGLIGDLRYRRVVDWDIPPFCFREFVQIHVGSGPNLLLSTTDGFRSPDPLATPGPFVGAPPTTLFPGDPDYFGGPVDQGVLFDLQFGQLKPCRKRKFTIFYGASETVEEALAAINAVGASMYSLGIPRNEAFEPSFDGPNIYILAFRFEKPKRGIPFDE